MAEILRIARKEFAAFFAAPIAFIFLGAFLAVTLFVFFWVETFFARNVADVRPLFQWLPVLLIFLVAAITMRMWAEERRAGTLEVLLTTPVKPLHFVLGKFLACLGLVAVALALTLPLPVTISLLGPLDWGPVAGGYLATLFLAAAYISIGLFVSARTDNQIVSLIVTTALCGLFYLLGSDTLTGLVGTRGAELLKLLGTGSRFQSITRGVIDLRDLYYYLSLVGVFLSLNVYALERLRWAGNPRNPRHLRWGLVTLLLAANFLAANLWLQPIGWARADITEGRIYSISDATRSYLARLREPLLIRGYFSAKTHPLLAPLVPRLEDLLQEYAVAGGGKVRVEFIDPAEHPDLEQEAAQKYGIKPVPFQTASKYQASIVNSYFDILVKYGDQYETLGFRDLIEVKARSESDLQVDLRNPEYDITRAIKKVLYAYQGSGQLFDNIPRPLTFHAYLSPDDRLPKQLVQLKKDLRAILEELRKDAGDKLSVRFEDPDADGGALARRLKEDYGFRPMATGLFDKNTFWFYMTLDDGDQVVQVPFPEDLNKGALERGIQAALKRFSRGFLKTVALFTPPQTPRLPQFGFAGGGKRFQWLRDKLGENFSVRSTDLKAGRVPEETDILVVVSPENLDDKQRFAIDQFLMQGGTVILATSPFDVEMQGALAAKPLDSGLRDWLSHNGIDIEKRMVLDPRNSAFPIPIQRNVGGFIIQETRMVEYPYFIDIRGEGIRDSRLAAGVDQVTMNWASPIHIDQDKVKGRRVTRLLESSSRAWTSDSINIQPDFRSHPQWGFAEGTQRGRQLLAVMVEGRFDSWYAGKPSPLLAAQDKAKEGKKATQDPGSKEQDDEKEAPVIARVIDKSPESARLIVFASNTFLSDEALDLEAGALGTRYLNPVQLVENAVDWSLEDRGLLEIRGRGHYSRTLPPLERGQQMFWEYLNYGLALLGLGMVWLLRRHAMVRARRRYQAMLHEGGAGA
ncbi:MAG TPA: ABC transporter permease [Gammaproteobacteria bacterium]|nr:ABC transporter permease [Gammaproteobacteria bacterium]